MQQIVDILDRVADFDEDPAKRLLVAVFAQTLLRLQEPKHIEEFCVAVVQAAITTAGRVVEAHQAHKDATNPTIQ